MRARPRIDANPWTLKILEVIEDGEWWDYDKVLSIVTPLVPPGMAWRHAESTRAARYKSLGRPVAERTRGSREDTIKTGQRAFVRNSINALYANGRIIVEYGDQPKRKRPLRIRLYTGDPKTQPEPVQRAHPWSKKIIEILEDGEWWPFETVVDIAGALVPEDLAFEKNKNIRSSHSTVRVPSYDEAVRQGRRVYIVNAIRSFRDNGRIEVKYGEQPKRKRPSEIRLDPNYSLVHPSPRSSRSR